jgi:hypothetical protein
MGVAMRVVKLLIVVSVVAVSAQAIIIMDSATLAQISENLAKASAKLADSTRSFADSNITIDTLAKNVSSFTNVLKDFKEGSVSLIVLLAVLIKLLISLMKFPKIASILDTPKVKPIKPYIAVVLGILSGVAAGLSMGQPLLTSIITGLTAGLGSIGIHETLKSLQNKNV